MRSCMCMCANNTRTYPPPTASPNVQQPIHNSLCLLPHTNCSTCLHLDVFLRVDYILPSLAAHTKVPQLVPATARCTGILARFLFVHTKQEFVSTAIAALSTPENCGVVVTFLQRCACPHRAAPIRRWARSGWPMVRSTAVWWSSLCPSWC